MSIINSSNRLYGQTDLNYAATLKNELDSLRPLDKEAEARIMQKFRLDWNYHSNHLEGTQLTYGETKALILFGITAQGKPLRDHIEITGHNEAIELVVEVVKDEYPLTESFIRQLHQLLLKEPYYVDAQTPDGKPSKRLVEIGKYKSHPNHVLTQTGEMFYFATPEETPSKMTDLIDWFREKKDEIGINPVILAAEFHYSFIRIHPFDDGNGRLARILMNFILMQFGYPPVVIKTEDKNNYFSVLRQADAGILEPFVEYIAKNLSRSLEIMIKGAKGESIEDPDDLDKELALLEQKLKIVGQGYSVERSKQVLDSLYDQTISPLLEKFYTTASKFDKFYTSATPMIKFDKSALYVKNFDFQPFRGHIKDNSTNVDFYYSYDSFNKSGFEGFDFWSAGAFRFSLTTYALAGGGKTFYEKPYSEQMTEEEIDSFISYMTKRHTEHIESELNKKLSVKE